MSTRYVCIHGHFYQPSRENPWLEAVEVQDAAAPYHDWNERVTAECYARNAAARILDDHERIARIVNNYAHISFNVGPTLQRWLARHASDVQAQIREADRQSRQQQYGHGNAMAQAYNHMIMPLASPQDRQTQVRWGIRDFERRFHRYPEGMWLPEAAVDLATLEVLASHRILFTILAPHQARRIRPSPDASWIPVTADTLDVTIPYRCRLPSGRSITIFFYDAPISRAIAFEGLLTDGAALAQRILARLDSQPSESGERNSLASSAGARILTIATDGESYGHHHRFGEMALASTLDRLQAEESVRLTNPAAYLAAHPPVAEVELAEQTSWSCVHGIERWRSDCGCNTGKGWHQRWRGPLRATIDWLKSQLDEVFERAGADLLRHPWEARHDAIELLDREPGTADAFFHRHAVSALPPARRAAALRLLEMQHQGMLMQSSDGWFFDDISRPETMQILAHAARAIDLARSFGMSLDAPFVDRLREAPGNVERYPDGAAVYERLVRPAAMPTLRLVATYAVTALVERIPHSQIYSATMEEVSREVATAGRHTLTVGRVQVRGSITEEDEEAAYALVHFGGHEVHCAVQVGWTAERFAAFRDNVLPRFGKDVLSEVMRVIDVAFGATYFTLRDLPLEDRRRVLARLTAQTMTALEDTYRRVYQENRALMDYLRDVEAPIPAPLLLAAVVTLTRDLETELSSDPAKPLSSRAFALVDELRSWGREVRADRFEPLLRRRLEAALGADTSLRERLARAAQVLDLAASAGITLNLWGAQNAFYRLARSPQAQETMELVRELGDRLQFNVEAAMAEAAQTRP